MELLELFHSNCWFIFFVLSYPIKKNSCGKRNKIAKLPETYPDVLREFLIPKVGTG